MISRIARATIVARPTISVLWFFPGLVGRGFYPADSFDSLCRYRSVMVVFLLLLFLLLLFAQNNSAGNLFPGLTTLYNSTTTQLRNHSQPPAGRRYRPDVRVCGFDTLRAGGRRC
jgi:hypothetical protein